MQSYTLRPTGRAPVAFVGELVTMISGDAEWGPQKHGRAMKRQDTVNVYRTRSGKSWIVQIVYQTTWDHEQDASDVHTVRAPDEATAARRIADVLRGYDPCRYLVGYPTGEHFAERQQALLARHERDWERLTGEVLAALPASVEVIE